ncbi:MAG TPA: Gfo/Idh/MocA family oxidoreductase, partial [Armatimonadota bacterium]|nr:Gfo/Idh/MocA family oxidoreductase [Armatimonadota bacterium]
MAGSTYRAAIIGTGGIAPIHVGYYREHPRTQLIAASDVREAVVQEFGKKYGVPHCYTDYRELLEREKPDVVSICTWLPTHPEIAIAVAEAGVRGILCEKPMSVHLGDARQMVVVCAKLGTALAIHHQRRFWAPLVEARRRVAAGEIGTPLTGIWRAVGGMLNNGAHGVDIHRFVLGDPEPAWVMAQLERKTNRWERGVMIEDRVTANIRFHNGYELALEVDMDERAMPCWYVFGSEGLIKLEGGETILYRRGAAKVLTGSAEPDPLAELLDWVEGGPEARHAGQIALVTQEIL